MRHPHYQAPPVTRRDMLRTCGCGFGGLALSSLLQQDLLPRRTTRWPPRAPHFAPRAKRIIFLHMHGGPSQHDLFEYKPLLVRDDNKPLPFAKPDVQFNETGNLFKSPWEFRRHGQSGHWVSELLPNLAGVADDLCFMRSMYGTKRRPRRGHPRHEHGQRPLRAAVDGVVDLVRARHREREPPRVHDHLPVVPARRRAEHYSAAFLPAAYNGTAIGNTRMNTAEATIDFLENQAVSPAVQRAEVDLLQRWQRRQLESTGPDLALEGRIESYELAFRMQTEAPS